MRFILESYILEDVVKDFCLQIIRLYLHLITELKQFEIGKQILRKGTNIGSLIKENEINALEEAVKTRYWIELIYESNFINKAQYNEYLESITKIIELLKESIEKKVFVEASS